MKNRIDYLLKKAKERKLLLQSGNLLGHQLNQRLVIVSPNQSLTHSQISELLDSNCLLVLDVDKASSKSTNNALTLLNWICKNRGLRSPFLVYGQYWCVNPYLKAIQEETNQSNK